MTDYLKALIDYRQTETASALDELSFWSSRFGHLLFKHLELRPSLKVLDVGFGTGFPLLELANVLGPTSRVVGLDVWKEAMSRARLKQRVHGLKNVVMVEGDGARQPFEDSAFDLIVSNLGINNFSAPEVVLAECFRVARSGARLALTTNLLGHFKEFYALYREVLKELGMNERLERLSVNEAHRGTLATVSRLLERAGFTLLKVLEDEFQMRFLDGSAMFRHFLVRLGFMDGWRAVLEPALEERVFTILEERLNRLASEQGELRMTVPMLYVEAFKP